MEHSLRDVLSEVRRHPECSLVVWSLKNKLLNGAERLLDKKAIPSLNLPVVMPSAKVHEMNKVPFKKKKRPHILSLNERVAAIRRYETDPSFVNVSRHFHCCVHQIKRIIVQKDKILKEWEDRAKNSEVDPKREMQISFLGKAVYEWVRRMMFYSHFDLTDALIQTMAFQFKKALNLTTFIHDKRWVATFRNTYSLKEVSTKTLGIGCQEGLSVQVPDILRYLESSRGWSEGAPATAVSTQVSQVNRNEAPALSAEHTRSKPPTHYATNDADILRNLESSRGWSEGAPATAVSTQVSQVNRNEAPAFSAEHTRSKPPTHYATNDADILRNLESSRGWSEGAPATAVSTQVSQVNRNEAPALSAEHTRSKPPTHYATNDADILRNLESSRGWSEGAPATAVSTQVSQVNRNEAPALSAEHTRSKPPTYYATNDADILRNLESSRGWSEGAPATAVSTQVSQVNRNEAPALSAEHKRSKAPKRNATKDADILRNLKRSRGSSDVAPATAVSTRVSQVNRNEAPAFSAEHKRSKAPTGNATNDAGYSCAPSTSSVALRTRSNTKSALSTKQTEPPALIKSEPFDEVVEVKMETDDNRVTHEEAIQCVKKLEEYALLKENFRLIGLVERLEAALKEKA